MEIYPAIHALVLSLAVLPDKVLFTGFGATDLVEVSSTGVTPVLIPRRASIGSTCNSGEDIAATPAASEVDETQIMGLLVSPLYTQKREASADPPRIFHSNKENSVSSPSHIRASTGKPATVYSHKKVEQKRKNCTRRTPMV